MKYTCIKNGVTSGIGYLGRIIGRHPFYFVVTPFIITAIFSTGLTKTKLNEDEDISYLLNADRGKIFENKQYLKRMFPMNTSDLFSSERIIDRPKFPIIYFLNKRGGNMLSKDILLEIEKFDKIAKNITVMVKGKVISYSDICAIVMNRCFENPISRLLAHVDEVVSKKIRFKFPFELDPITFVYQLYVTNFGGVKTDKDGYVEEADSIRLMYPLDESNSDKSNWIKEWRRKFFKIMKAYDFRHIQIFPEPFQTTELQFMPLTENCKHLIGIIIVIITIFCIINFTTNDCVKSKPWLGVAMVVSAGMATVSGFGLMVFCGVKFMQFNITLPFLIIATEIDDAFVMVACWRISNHCDSVDKRMEATYSEAAVSITLTSLTNFLSYCIPMSTEFPSVRIFCSYAATCIFFTYVFQITFFGGCMALSGYREEKGIHAFRCKIVKEHFRDYNTVQDEEKEYSMNFLAKKPIKIVFLFLKQDNCYSPIFPQLSNRYLGSY